MKNLTNLPKKLCEFPPGLLRSFLPTFYEHLCVERSQKRKKTLMTWLSFALLGSASVKAPRKHVGEIDPPALQIENFASVRENQQLRL